MASDTGKIGVIPKSYSYSDQVKPVTVVTKGVVKQPRSLVYDVQNGIILILETDTAPANNGKI